MGSKSRFAKEILKIALQDRGPDQWYIEPFAGGMNVICEVDGNRFANDVNFYLVQMWTAIVDGWIPSKITREEYIDIRDNRNKYPDYLVGWVGYNCSYSGKWFGGFAGEAKTKIGTVRDYQSEAIKNVLRQAEKMKGVVFTCDSYQDVDLASGSIVYCDPPYAGATGYGRSFDHEAFWEWVRCASKDGHDVYVSEYSAPNDFSCVWEKEAHSSLSANGRFGGSKSSIERLFVYNKK